MILSPILPSSLDVTKYRLSTLSQQQYKEIAQIARDTYQEVGDEYDRFPFDNSFDDLLEQKHDFFSISTFPVDVTVDPNYISIDWSSGLAGGYALIILNEGGLPDWMKDYYPIYIYDDVVLIVR
ncbi:MAG: hypothetical protein HRU38_20835 [Saccharospirillaceae bacterium]|nr:hypothetical protein [Pseudomonadales bacterium]NRB81078.1 hypothetical protein [Saccharospirillaceae bacterium]